MLFRRVRTQWRTSATCVVGLDYNVLFRLMDNSGLSGEDWDDMLEKVQAIEEGAVSAMLPDDN